MVMIVCRLSSPHDKPIIMLDSNISVFVNILNIMATGLTSQFGSWENTATNITDSSHNRSTSVFL